MKWLTKDHPADQWENWEYNPGLLNLRSVLYPLRYIAPQCNLFSPVSVILKNVFKNCIWTFTIHTNDRQDF